MAEKDLLIDSQVDHESIDELDFEDDMESGVPSSYQPSNTAASTTATSQDSGASAENENLLNRGSAAGTSAFWSLQYYQQFFDVDTSDVAQRLLLAVNPTKGKSFDGHNMRPDFYGPFWICTTLIFLLAAIGNLASYLSTSNPDAWMYDFEKVTFAASFIYAYASVTPIIACLVMHYLGVEYMFSNVLCVYGYSLVSYVPVSLLCAIPNELLSLICVVTAFALSTLFLVRNVADDLSEQIDKQKALVFYVCIAGAHFGFAIMMKYVFFKYE